jgi:hypothetical protein
MEAGTIDQQETDSLSRDRCCWLQVGEGRDRNPFEASRSTTQTRGRVKADELNTQGDVIPGRALGAESTARNMGKLTLAGGGTQGSLDLAKHGVKECLCS